MDVNGEHHSPAALLPGKNLHYPLNRRLVGPQSHSGRFGEEMNLMLLSDFEHRTFQPVVWSLYRLRHCDAILLYNLQVSPEQNLRIYQGVLLVIVSES
jgi:hypothetical protein